MLKLLVHSSENGLRVIRQLIDVSINHFSGGRDHGQDAITIRFPAGDRKFPWIRSYNWSRGGSQSSIVTSASMALEAWQPLNQCQSNQNATYPGVEGRCCAHPTALPGGTRKRHLTLCRPGNTLTLC
jgi:hypothetical protein